MFVEKRPALMTLRLRRDDLKKVIFFLAFLLNFVCNRDSQFLFFFFFTMAAAPPTSTHLVVKKYLSWQKYKSCKFLRLQIQIHFI